MLPFHPGRYYLTPQSQYGTDDWTAEFIKISAANCATVKFNLENQKVTETGVIIDKCVEEPEIKTKFNGLVITSDKRHAGTDATVEIWLTDSTGKTAGPLKITEKGDAMERGQRNPIVITLISDLVDLYKIAIRHDGSQKYPDWHLDRIELTMVDPKSDKALHDTPTIFYFKEWIKSNIVFEAGCNNIKNSAYTVRVKTTNALWAGTDDDVFIDIVGSKGTFPQL